jgi:hypothetical protein
MITKKWTTKTWKRVAKLKGEDHQEMDDQDQEKGGRTQGNNH